MRAVESVRVLLTVLCVFGSSTEARMTPPRQPRDDVKDLYHAGKIDEARERARTYVEQWLAEAAPEKLTSEEELSKGLTLVMWAGDVLGAVFVGEKGRVSSEAVFDLSARVRTALDNTLKQAIEMKDIDEDTRHWMDVVQRTRRSLVLSEIVALRDAGHKDRALSLAEQYPTIVGEYLETLGITLEDFVSQVTGPSKEESIGPGAALPIVQLLLTYYKALETENVMEVDACLCKGEGLRTGAQILERLESEKNTRGQFDSLGPVSMDGNTKLTIMPLTHGRLSVSVEGIVKRARKDGKDISKRTNDKFVVRSAQGEYKLAFETVAPSREEKVR